MDKIFMKNRLLFILAGTIFVFLAMPVPFAVAQSPVCMGEPSCPNPGNVCKDGTVFAGCSPDDAGTHQYRLFVTRCDAGQTWGGASCTGTRSSLNWGSIGTARGTESVTDGEANTNTLGALGAVAHPAAHYCFNLTIHGYSDWYLPAAAEAYTMMYNKAAINTFEA